MKTIPEILALLEAKLNKHKAVIDKLVVELTEIKKKELTPEIKQQVMHYAITIAEHKACINSLKELKESINV